MIVPAGVAANVISYSRRPWFDAEPPLPRKFRKGGREAPDNKGGGSDGGGGGACQSVRKALGVVWEELVGFIVPLRHKPFLYLVLFQVRAHKPLACGQLFPLLARNVLSPLWPSQRPCATTLRRSAVAHDPSAVVAQVCNSIDFGGFYLYFVQDYVAPHFTLFGWSDLIRF